MRKTLLTESQDDDNDGNNKSTDPSEPVTVPDPAEAVNATEAHLTEGLPENARGGQESAWISHWLDQVRDIEEIAVCEVVDFGASLSALRSKTDLAHPSPPKMLIDSGDIASVAGRAWICKWLQLAVISSFPTVSPISKVFRFGNQCAYPSSGLIRANGRGSARTSGGGETVL